MKKSHERLNITMVKNQNQKLVFHYISRHGPITRSDISLSTGLSHGTVKTIMDEFFTAGLIQEKKDYSPLVGRKPCKALLKSDARRIGILELAPDSLTYTDLDLSLDPLSPPTITTRPADKDYRTWMEEFLAKLPVGSTDENQCPLAGIGVVAPGPYCRETDSVISTLIPGLKQIPLEKTVRGLNDIPVIIGEDVHLAALAEADAFEGGIQPLFFLYLSRGVGGAYLSDGVILTGTDGMAGEIGQMIMDDGHRLEESIGWLQTREALNVPAAMSDADAREFILRSLAENGEARAVLNTIINRLTKALSHAVCLLNPKTIIIGGVFNFLGRQFSGPLEQELRKLLIDAHKSDLTMFMSVSGKRNMRLGAGMLVLDRWLETEFR